MCQVNWMNGPPAIGWAGRVYWPGHGLLEIDSDRHRKNFPAVSTLCMFR